MCLEADVIKASFALNSTRLLLIPVESYKHYTNICFFSPLQSLTVNKEESISCFSLLPVDELRLRNESLSLCVAVKVASGKMSDQRERIITLSLE